MPAPKQPISAGDAVEINTQIKHLQQQAGGKFPRNCDIAACVNRPDQSISRLLQGKSPFSMIATGGISPPGRPVYGRFMPPGWGYVYAPKLSARLRAPSAANSLPNWSPGDDED